MNESKSLFESIIEHSEEETTLDEAEGYNPELANLIEQALSHRHTEIGKKVLRKSRKNQPPLSRVAALDYRSIIYFNNKRD